MGSHSLAEIEASQGGTLVRFPAGVLDAEAVRAVRRELARSADPSLRRDLSLDLGNVRFVTAEALSGLVALHGELRACGKALTVVNVRPLLAEVFAVTRLTGSLGVRPESSRS